MRADLPKGTAAAQLTHAAGMSFGPTPLDATVHAVVLEVPDENALLELMPKLDSSGNSYVAFREPDPPYLGQVTAIGVRPTTDRSSLAFLRSLPLYGKEK